MYLEVPLIPARKLVGRVLSPEGEPVADAEIQVNGYYARASGVFAADGASTRSNQRGEFELDGIRADIKHTLDIRADRFAGVQMVIPPFENVEGTDVDCGEIILGEAVEIRGRITDSALAPAEGLTVKSTLLGERPVFGRGFSIEQSSHRGTPILMWPEFTAISDSEGYYSCAGMSAGRYSVVVTGDEGRALSAHFGQLATSESATSLEVAVGSTEVNVVLGADEWSLSGKVDMPNGWKRGQVEIFKTPATSGRRVSIDESGKFVICGLRQGSLEEYRLKAIVRTGNGQVVCSEELSGVSVQAGNVLEIAESAGF
ncbi:MAG: carboxypeptidase regulatory-like domain-containing protein [bacterium]|nr:carboxypeptidase regulatory-like domain-containing protein [bacterium]